MPLSEYEKRLLDEIEQTLRTDDPALASSLRAARPQIRTRNFVALAVLGLLVGVGLLVAALRVHGVVMVVLAIVGFGFVVTGADFGVRVLSRLREQRRHDHGGDPRPRLRRSRP